MEIEFREKPITYLRENVVELLYQEETAEVIVPDSYPDVQAVVDCCAVGCVKDQELLTGTMNVSGAFQVGMLYTPEGDGAPVALENWMPFTLHLNREEISAECIGTTELRIRSADARILNSRKILIRVNYALRLTVYEHTTFCLHETESNEKLQLRRETVRGVYPIACSEQTVTVSELAELPTAADDVRKMIKAIPDVHLSDCRIIEDRGVAKGILALHLLYQLENGTLACFDVQTPFSQLFEFDADVMDGIARCIPTLADFRLDREADGWLYTADIRMQMVVWKEVELPLITDGYCVGHTFEAAYSNHTLLEALDAPVTAKTAEGKLRGNVKRLVDCAAWVDFPVCRRNSDEIAVSTAVTLHALYYDDADRLCGETLKCEETANFALAADAVCFADADATGSSYIALSGPNSVVCCAVNLTARCFAERKVSTMCAAAIGEPISASEDRPSLIVRRTEAGDLWDLAKASGATVQAICEANGLQSQILEEPHLLLIPTA